ncbi:Selt-like protein [Thalictrum thalictroides]|uniref:Selt-like protein n=1 Tax=Thalictrum thalictroides TaxID=46969 RepID=A0A7J6V6T6_THATH|nr:Selt-like protein [Thalictrum thalictroides]
MKDLLEDFFPGVHVKLDIQPPDFPRPQLIRCLRMGGLALIAVGTHIQLNFNLFLLRTYSFWNSLKSTTILLERTEAFEVHINGELIFSKLKEDRFPTEFELRELVARKAVDSTTADGLVAGVLWA